MNDDWRRDAFRAALKMVENGPPKDIVSRAQPEAADRGTTLSASDLTDVLRSADATDPFLSALGMQVHKWDAALPGEEWSKGTAPSSMERRNRICELLGIDTEGAEILLTKRGLFRDETLVITAPWERWYTAPVAGDHAFYWPRYRDYLLNVKEWPEASVTSLDLATSDVIERLTDPTRAAAHQSKGLVVGYVQSGKTANFTGVAAKAIDAGYRLVIVMTGTIEMLRAQTQRRIDMEMVGRQNILGDLSPEQAAESKVDYQDDAAWVNGEFIDLGEDELATEIRRLTQHRKDYQKQFRTLKIDRFDMGRPLYDASKPVPFRGPGGDRQEECHGPPQAGHRHQGEQERFCRDPGAADRRRIGPGVDQHGRPREGQGCQGGREGDQEAQGDQRTDRRDARTDATGAVRGLHGNPVRQRVRGPVRRTGHFSEGLRHRSATTARLHGNR